MTAASRVGEALALLRAGRAEAAMAHLQPLLSVDNPDPDALKIAINAAIARDAVADAWQWFSQLRRQVTLDGGLARVGSRIANRLGAQHEAMGLGLRAHADYREALALWPENPDAAANCLRLDLAVADPACNSVDAGSLPAATAAAVRAHQAVWSGQPAALDEAAADTVPALLHQREHDTPDRAPRPELAGVRRLADRLALPMVYRDGADLAAWRQRFTEHLALLVREPEAGPDPDGLKSIAWTNFLLAYQGGDDTLLQSRYGDWLANRAAALRPDLATPPEARKPGPTRIGLVSGHWYQSTVGSYFAAWIGALVDDGHAVDVLAMAPNLDAFTEAIVPPKARLVRLSDDPDRAAEQVRSGDYDLLLYPELGIDTRLLPMAALPLARRQWLAWGHPVTSGLPTMDAYLSVATMEPADAPAHYRENLLLLPGIGTRYRAPDAIAKTDRQALGLPAGTLLVCPQSPFKIHPEQDARFAAALAAIPDSRLLLFASERPVALAKLRARLSARLDAEGLDPARVLVCPMLPRARFLEVLGACDLMLDTCHWSGGNTALDALFAGLPMVAEASRFMRGRQSAAMLGLAGLDHAVATGLPDYGERARAVLEGPRIDWARAFEAATADRGALAALCGHVRNGLAEPPKKAYACRPNPAPTA